MACISTSIMVRYNTYQHNFIVDRRVVVGYVVNRTVVTDSQVSTYRTGHSQDFISGWAQGSGLEEFLKLIFTIMVRNAFPLYFASLL